MIRLLLAVVIFAISAMANAEETTFGGPSGFIYVPNANVLQKKVVNLGMWIDSDWYSSISLTGGLGAGIEAGVCESIPKDSGSHTFLHFNWTLLKENKLSPAVSYGMRSRWNYLAITKNIGLLKGMTIGIITETKDFEQYEIAGGFKLSFADNWYFTTDYFQDKINTGVRMPYIGLLGVSIPNDNYKNVKAIWGYTYQVDFNK